MRLFKNKLQAFSSFAAFLVIVGITSCAGKSKAAEGNKDEAEGSQTEKGFPYDLKNPVRFILPEVLLEVSGITFYKGNSEILYAEQDEAGKVYFLKPGDKEAKHIKFAGSGDYEDIAIFNEQVVVLRSDGVLYSFPFSEIGKEEKIESKVWEGVLPAGEYEGMFADEDAQQLVVLCKSCEADKGEDLLSGYVLHFEGKDLAVKTHFTIDSKSIAKLLDKRKLKFKPSALAKKKETNEWYILSSANKVLVVTDSQWQVKAVYPLNPQLFPQPEGIAFDKESNLYISNEGDKLSNGDVLKFGRIRGE